MQEYINMLTALIVLLGGMFIVFLYPGTLEIQYRVLIGIFVFLYSALRFGQAVMGIRRRRRSKISDFGDIVRNQEDQGEQHYSFHWLPYVV